jgi:hypothetical protein
MSKNKYSFRIRNGIPKMTVITTQIVENSTFLKRIP